jgi:alpha-galactosidase
MGYIKGWSAFVKECAMSLLAFRPVGKVWRVAALFSLGPVLLASIAAALNYNDWRMYLPMSTNANELPTAFAVRLTDPPDAEGFPSESAWGKCPRMRFENDWQGQNADPDRATEVQLLWTPDTLFLKFHARYRTITVFPDARGDGWRDELWNRDVAEAFLQPDSRDPWKYKEFEVSPNGFWIDLDLVNRKHTELHSRMRRRVVQDVQAKTWTAELSIPMPSLTPHFDPQQSWRVNFFRVEGAAEPRFYSAWSPTFSHEPDFHVPGAFGKLVFRE